MKNGLQGAIHDKLDLCAGHRLMLDYDLLLGVNPGPCNTGPRQT